jgi:glycosyltransferase involved in cell wall biosynthesis
MPALISCIVPVFNGEKYLAEALESILSQTYRPIEPIVVDDGSSDGTAALTARFASRIRYVRQNKSGPPTARNLGLSLAQGEFVAFLDADDLWHPEKLDRQVACFTADPEIDLCITHVENFWIPELEDEATRFRDNRLARAVPGYVTQTLLARRALFERIGPFNTVIQHGDAQEWFLRAAEQGAVMKVVSDVLVYRRLHAGNFSRQISATLDDHLRIVKASLDRRRRGDTPVRVYNFPGSNAELKTKTKPRF